MYTHRVYLSISQRSLYMCTVHGIIDGISTPYKGKRKKKFAKLGEKSDFIKKKHTQSKVTQKKEATTTTTTTTKKKLK